MKTQRLLTLLAEIPKAGRTWSLHYTLVPPGKRLALLRKILQRGVMDSNDETPNMM